MTFPYYQSKFKNIAPNCLDAWHRFWLANLPFTDSPPDQFNKDYSYYVDNGISMFDDMYALGKLSIYDNAILEYEETLASMQRELWHLGCPEEDAHDYLLILKDGWIKDNDPNDDRFKKVMQL